MNRDKDFHKKETGVLINKNTKDYRRAKNRNKVMKTAVSALGEDGVLAVVAKKVDKIVNSPSRADERVVELELQLKKQKIVNKEIKNKLEKALTDNEGIKNQLTENIQANTEVNDKLTEAFITKNDFLKLGKRIKDLEDKNNNKDKVK